MRCIALSPWKAHSGSPARRWHKAEEDLFAGWLHYFMASATYMETLAWITSAVSSRLLTPLK